VYLSFTSNQIQETLHWVLGFGSDIKVINPPELVEKVKEETKNILKKYK
jgi:predicted DNA-binding transcriptional regulator YafY